MVKNGTIELQSLSEIAKLPILTKEIVREKEELLVSDDHISRKSYKNFSGGSTGEPMTFMADEQHETSNQAHFYLIMLWRGAKYYESTIKFWGAERDTFGNNKPFFEIFKDFCRNRIVLNSNKMSEDDMRYYIKLLNTHKPKLIITYVQSIHEIALYAKKNNLHVEPQNAIHSAAGTLHEFMRDTIEEVFQCKVYNHYGSRESGAIASECFEKDGLHIMMNHTVVEIVDDEGQSVVPGEQGNILITTLNNFSMPLIRYKLGDIATMKEYAPCKCGCTYPKLQEVIGRSSDIFKTLQGGIVNPLYFAFLIDDLNKKMNIKKIQAIQKKLDLILIKIVKDHDLTQDNLNYIKYKVQLVMTELCAVKFEFVDEIPKTATGKYLDTISEI